VFKLFKVFILGNVNLPVLRQTNAVIDGTLLVPRQNSFYSVVTGKVRSHVAKFTCEGDDFGCLDECVSVNIAVVEVECLA
jgi:hypothetical protein